VKKVRSKEKLAKVLIAPIVSEKASLVGDRENAVVFAVHLQATKDDIKQAVEMFFNVTVLSVRTTIKGREVVRFGQRQGVTRKKKKAYVKLAVGQEINLQEMSG